MKAREGSVVEAEVKKKGIDVKVRVLCRTIVVQIESGEKSEFKIDFELIKVIIFKNLCSVFLNLSWNL